MATFSSSTSTPTTQEQQQQLKDKFIQTLGSASCWDEGWRSTLALSPSFFEASLALRAVPLTKGHLPRKVQHLVALTVDSAATHLYVPGIRADVRAALDAGATVAEVVEVVELASTLGIHACNVGVPLLVEVMKEEGVYDEHFPPPARSTGEDGSAPAPEWGPYRQRLKDEFTAKRGYWHPTWEDFLRVDPEFFEAYMAFSSVPWTKEVGSSRQGALEPKVTTPPPLGPLTGALPKWSQAGADFLPLGGEQVKELIYCAFDAAATHLYVTGLKLHMRNALGYGATPQEIAEVLEIASLLSLHTAHTTFPVVLEEAGIKQKQQ